jgi:hypothetical protein
MSLKHAPFNAVLGVVVGLLFIAFSAFTLGRMSVNALLFLSVVALAGMMLLGIFVSLHPDRSWVKQRRTAIAVIFGTLGMTGAVVASIQGLRANRETFGIQDNLSNAVKRISDLEAELARVRTDAAAAREQASRSQALNTELQQKLLEQSTQLKDLAVQKVAEATGGDGFAYLDLGSQQTAEKPDNGVALQARVSGNFPLRQVRYRIADGGLVDLGDLAPRSTRLLDTLLQPSREAGGRFKITILAANGPVLEDLELRFNAAGKRWERRVRVSRDGQILLERDWGH